MSLRYNPKKPSILKKDHPKKTRTPKSAEKLQPVSQASTRLEEDYDSKSITDAIDHIMSRQWNIIPAQLNPDFQNHIQKYRDFLPKLVSRYQLYSLYLNNQTFIDQEIDQLFEDQKIKRVLLQDNDDLNDFIIKSEEYIAVLNDYIQKPNDYDTKVAVQSFKKYLDANPKFLKTSKESIVQYITNDHVTILLRLGFLQIIPRSTNNSSTLKISIPRYGYIINLYQIAKKFILKTLTSTNNKWKEMKHNDLYEKWESYKLKFKDFKGLNLSWILHWLIGEGILEVFQISDGKAYRVIRQ